jgi:intracellular protein transport protein USO1
MSARDFLSQTYIALRGPTGAPQSAADAIAKLSDRLGPSTLLSDRRAAILSLKGLARDHKLEVGERALRGLLDVLENDAEVDPDTALPVVETLNTLCEADEDDHSARALGLKHCDIMLENDKPVHKLLTLASQQSFYPRYATLKVLIILLKHRRPKTQQYFLTAPSGAAIALTMLDDQREMMRNGVCPSSQIHLLFTSGREP